MNTVYSPVVFLTCLLYIEIIRMAVLQILKELFQYIKLHFSDICQKVFFLSHFTRLMCVFTGYDTQTPAISTLFSCGLTYDQKREFLLLLYAVTPTTWLE